MDGTVRSNIGDYSSDKLREGGRVVAYWRTYYRQTRLIEGDQNNGEETGLMEVGDMPSGGRRHA